MAAIEAGIGQQDGFSVPQFQHMMRTVLAAYPATNAFFPIDDDLIIVSHYI
jgi:hypothetical protein